MAFTQILHIDVVTEQRAVLPIQSDCEILLQGVDNSDDLLGVGTAACSEDA